MIGGSQWNINRMVKFFGNGFHTRLALKKIGDMGRPDKFFAFNQIKGPLEDMPQFPHISRPGMIKKNVFQAPRQTFDHFFVNFVELFDKMVA